MNFSSCNSQCSSFYDLDEEELTKNYSDADGTTTSSSSQQRSCSFTDLHLPTPAATEMVINLPSEFRAADQSRDRTSSREPPLTACAPTRSTTTWLSFSHCETTARDGSMLGANCGNSVVASDASSNSGDIMQVNVPPNPPQVNVVSSQTDAPENGLRSSSGTNSNIFASDLNLSSANVVGLPKNNNHVRYASVPSSGSVQNRSSNGTAAGTIFPNHSRNVSEPVSQFVKYSNGLSQPPATVVPNHRHSSQVDQSNPHQINHFRSSSVPKSVPLVPRKDNNPTTPSFNAPRLSQKPSPQHFNGNVSNVNVNFYRAVPVNVVSSVPTIHCLNTLQGNDVSNVQVLPLSTNYQSSTPATNNTSYVSGTTGTTQVILHNAPASTTNSIHVPNPVRNAFDSQIIQVPSGRNTISGGTITNFLPLLR